jgi:hemerythrin
MATGVHFMDDEHRQLMDDLAALNSAFAANSRDVVNQRFQDLLAAMTDHFANEERAMRDGGLQDHYAEHKLEHDDFLTQLRFFGSRLAKTGNILPLDLSDFVSTWLVAHMLGQDRKMGHLLAGQSSLARAA